MKAILKNYRQSPRKVRLVASFIKGRPVSEAEIKLNFLAKRASAPIKKLLLSAAANAKNNFGIEKENLVIKDFQVNKGIVLKRIMPRARGSASRINKRTSNLVITLIEKAQKKAKVKSKK
jgi:large subunit ribosomal protein L22